MIRTPANRPQDGEDTVIDNEAMGSFPAAAERRHAPWLPVPDHHVTCVEHPCIIKNVDKGIKSLGGEVKLSQFLDLKDSSKTLSASLRPDDPLAKRIPSTSVRTTNLLLKVTVPKVTGCKRKRGSSVSFLAPSEHGVSEPPRSLEAPNTHPETLIRSLRDNAPKYHVDVVGHMDEAHRFRSLPDFQYSASRNHIMQNLRDSFLSLDATKLKTAAFDTASKIKFLPDVGPPARFSQSAIPFNYSYQQNRYVTYAKNAAGSGEVQVVAPQRRIPVNNLIIPIDSRSVPFETTLPAFAEHELPLEHREYIRLVREQFEQRPILTRHVLYNTLGWHHRDKIRLAISYCAYRFSSGPWKDGLIKFGIDPRTDPKYRHYQTMLFQRFRNEEFKHWKYLATETSPVALGIISRGHVFDGKTFAQTGHVFQVCDYTDPILRQILDTDDIRTTCSPHNHGWYHAGTWAKARVISREKGNIILDGATSDDRLFERILKFPEIITTTIVNEVKEGLKHDGQLIPRREIELMTAVRDLACVPERMDSVIRPSTLQVPSQTSRKIIKSLDGSEEIVEFGDAQNVEGVESDEYDEDEEDDDVDEESPEVNETGLSESEGDLESSEDTMEGETEIDDDTMAVDT